MESNEALIIDEMKVLVDELIQNVAESADGLDTIDETDENENEADSLDSSSSSVDDAAAEEEEEVENKDEDEQEMHTAPCKTTTCSVLHTRMRVSRALCAAIQLLLAPTETAAAVPRATCCYSYGENDVVADHMLDNMLIVLTPEDRSKAASAASSIRKCLSYGEASLRAAFEQLANDCEEGGDGNNEDLHDALSDALETLRAASGLQEPVIFCEAGVRALVSTRLHDVDGIAKGKAKCARDEILGVVELVCSRLEAQLFETVKKSSISQETEMALAACSWFRATMKAAVDGWFGSFVVSADTIVDAEKQFVDKVAFEAAIQHVTHAGDNTNVTTTSVGTADKSTQFFDLDWRASGGQLTKSDDGNGNSNYFMGNLRKLDRNGRWLQRWFVLCERTGRVHYFANGEKESIRRVYSVVGCNVWDGNSASAAKLDTARLPVLSSGRSLLAEWTACLFSDASTLAPPKVARRATLDNSVLTPRSEPSAAAIIADAHLLIVLEGVTVLDDDPLTAVDQSGRTKHIMLDPTAPQNKRVRLFLRADSAEAQRHWVERFELASKIGQKVAAVEQDEQVDEGDLEMPADWAQPDDVTHWLNAFEHRVHKDDDNNAEGESEDGGEDDAEWDAFADRLASASALRRGQMQTRKDLVSLTVEKRSDDVRFVKRVADVYAAGVFRRLAQMIPTLCLRGLDGAVSSLLDYALERAACEPGVC